MANSFKKMIGEKIIKRSDAGMLIRLDDIHVKEGFNRRIDDERTRIANEETFQYMKNGGRVSNLEVVPRDEGGVWVVEGHRRRLSYLRMRDEAGMPVEWIRIEPFTGNDVDRIARIMTSNNQLKLNDYEQSLVIKDLAALNLTPEEIAKAVHVSLPKVKQLMIIAYANHDVQDVLKNENISTQLVAERISELGDGAGDALKKDIEKAKEAGSKKVTKKTAGVKDSSPKFGVGKARKFVDLLSSAEIIEDGDRDIIVLPAGVKLDIIELLDEYRQIQAGQKSDEEGDSKNQIPISE